MPHVEIPKNIGRVRMVMALGGRFAVWNGKDRELKFEIVCRKRKTATELVRIINSGQHNGAVEYTE